MQFLQCLTFEGKAVLIPWLSDMAWMTNALFPLMSTLHPTSLGKQQSILKLKRSHARFFDKNSLKSVL